MSMSLFSAAHGFNVFQPSRRKVWARGTKAFAFGIERAKHSFAENARLSLKRKGYSKSFRGQSEAGG